MKKSLHLFVTVLFISWNHLIAQPYLDQYFDGADSLFYSSSYYRSLLVKIDTNAGNIWQVGPPQKTIFNSAATVPNALVTDTLNYYPVNNSSSFHFNVVPYWFTPWSILSLQWKQKLDFDKDRDGAIVEFSTDYGVSWQNALNNPYVYNYFGFDPQNQDTLLTTGQYSLSGTDTTWSDIWLCYDLSWLFGACDSIAVRFTMVSDSVNNSKEGWLIDNLHAHITMAHPVKEQKMTAYANVYPNPASDRINIQLEQINAYHIIEQLQLLTADGKVLKEWQKVPTRFWIDVKGYPPGKYFVKIKSNLRQETIPVIIQ